MHQVNSVLVNIGESLDLTSKNTAIANANIQPSLSCVSPVVVKKSSDNETATLSINTVNVTVDDSTLVMGEDNVLSLKKTYASADIASEYQPVFTTVGPNVTIDNGVISAVNTKYYAGSGTTVTKNKVYADLATSSNIGTVTVDSAYFSVTNGVISLSDNIYYGIRTALTTDDVLLNTFSPNNTDGAGVQFYSTLVDNDFVIYGGLGFTTETTKASTNFVIDVKTDSNVEYPDLSLRVTKTTKTIGSSVSPIYMENGTITKCSDTVGSMVHPIFLNAGEFSACTCNGAENKTHTLYISDGTLFNSMHNLGSDEYGIYLDNGVFKNCRPSFMNFYAQKVGSTFTYLTTDYALGIDGAANPMAITTVASVSATDSAVETAMDAGTTTFFARNAVDLTSMTTINFTSEIIGVPVDHMKPGVLYTYSYSYPEKIFRNSSTTSLSNYLTGNTLSAGSTFGIRIYTSSTATKHYHWIAGSTTYDMDAKMCLYGFDFSTSSTVNFDTFVKITTGNSVTMLFRTGIYESSSYCGNRIDNNITSITLMRGADLDGIPTIHVMGYNKVNT